MNITNPKVSILFLALLPQFIDPKAAGESLFLRKFVLGIQAQANSKTSRDRLCLRRPDRPAYVA
ncbi:hypothetical protein [Candidatus Reidiella endopervernicosa]|uniref:Uncharacterized protein n=1 Tax=Candidatus Reidiella endopervernicosa TaxID=2738883 RepID=A0A6N0HS71_9GAMM|nr:hypothetical protein [Candidatus Reidiella endopervernicosa]QKQ25111.1 hypothetical protein HUE57_01535 [Candidatus Reidiella endopervernicosa]